jgi:hypothetical protein
VKRKPKVFCVECGDLGDYTCESCEAKLCSDHADFTTYDDVQVCANEEACEKRCAAGRP